MKRQKKRYESLRTEELRASLPGIAADAEMEIERIDKRITKLKEADGKERTNGSPVITREDRSFQIGEADGSGSWFVKFDPKSRTAEIFEDDFTTDGVRHYVLCEYFFDDGTLKKYGTGKSERHDCEDAEKEILDIVEKMKEFLEAIKK